MNHLKSYKIFESGYNEFGSDVSKDLQEVLKDIFLEIEDDGYDVTYQWYTLQDNLPYILIETTGNGIDYDKIRDVVERINTVCSDMGWKLDVDSGSRYYQLTFYKISI